jgi:hypothetical protein
MSIVLRHVVRAVRLRSVCFRRARLECVCVVFVGIGKGEGNGGVDF